MKNLHFILLPLFLFITGCSTLSPDPKPFKQGDVSGIVLPGDVKTTYIKTHGDLDRFCASRGVDALATTDNDLSLGLSNGSVGENVGDNSGSGALSLGGRDPIVLITRELMYRVCELSMNLNLNKNETINMYKLFLRTITNISKNDKSEGVVGINADAPLKTSSTNDDEDDDDSDNNNNDDDNY